MSYLFLKYIHVISATVLFGSGLSLAFIGMRIFNSKNVKIIGSVGPIIVFLDVALTIPSAIVQLTTGFMMANIMEMNFFSGWTGASLKILILVACFFWLPGAWLQHQMSSIAKNCEVNRIGLSSRYLKYLKIWMLLGIPSTIGMLTIFYLMIFKPNL